MDSILQGTTPVLELEIDPDDFLVSDVVKLELTFLHKNQKTIHGLDEVSVDATNNSFSYHFTEEETLGLDIRAPLLYQLRFKLSNGEIVGTVKDSINITDLMSEEVMGE